MTVARAVMVTPLIMAGDLVRLGESGSFQATRSIPESPPGFLSSGVLIQPSAWFKGGFRIGADDG